MEEAGMSQRSIGGLREASCRFGASLLPRLLAHPPTRALLCCLAILLCHTVTLSLLPSPAGAEMLIVAGSMRGDTRMELVQTFDVSPGTAMLQLTVPRVLSVTSRSTNQEIRQFQTTFSAAPTRHATKRDTLGNEVDEILWDKPSGTIVVTTRFVAANTVNLAGWQSSAPYPLQAAPPQVQQYLGATPMVQKDDPAIVRKAQQLIQGSRSQREAVTRVLNFVVDHLRFALEPGQHDAAFALEQGVANCTGYSHLSMALLRAAGIPARAVLGLASDKPWPVSWGRGSLIMKSGKGPHAWFDVWYPDLGWVPYDAQSTHLFVPAYHIRQLVGRDLFELNTWFSYIGPAPKVDVRWSADVLDEHMDLRTLTTESEPRRYILAGEVKVALAQASSPEPVPPAPTVVVPSPPTPPSPLAKLPDPTPAATMPSPPEPIPPIVQPLGPPPPAEEPPATSPVTERPSSPPPPGPIAEPLAPPAPVEPPTPVARPPVSPPAVLPPAPPHPLPAVEPPSPSPAAEPSVPPPPVTEQPSSPPPPVPIAEPPAPVEPPTPVVQPPVPDPALPPLIPAPPLAQPPSPPPPVATPTPAPQPALPGRTDLTASLEFGNQEFPAALKIFTPIPGVRPGQVHTVRWALVPETAEYATGRTEFAQAFRLNVPMVLADVAFALQKFGGTTGELWLELRPDSGRAPGPTLLAESRRVPVGGIFPFGGYRWVVFDFDQEAEGPMLLPGRYWVILRHTGDGILNWYFTPSTAYGDPDDSRARPRGQRNWEDILNYRFNYRVSGLVKP
jgi:transglutaminase-like putative cysteine protease